LTRNPIAGKETAEHCWIVSDRLIILRFAERARLWNGRCYAPGAPAGCASFVFEEPFRNIGEAGIPMEPPRIPRWFYHQIGNRLG
jgi:hypothetical protein